MNNVNDWGTGRTVDVAVKNGRSTAATSWSVSFPWAGRVETVWNAVGTHDGSRLTSRNETWNGSLAAGATTSFGFNDGTSTGMPRPTTCAATLGGATVPCTITIAGTVTPTPTTPTPTPTPTPTTPAPTPTPTPTTPTPTPTPTPTTPTGNAKVVAYYTSWATYGRNYQVTDIPASQITHLNYAFANIANGKCVVGDTYADTDKFFPGDSWDAGSLRGNFNQLNKLKVQYPNLKTLISVGGWTWSANFSAAAATATSRSTFVKSCADFMETYGFDGIDIDWEYPVSGGLQAGTAADKANYTLLMQAFRAELDRREIEDRRDYLLTIAAPAGPSTLVNLEKSKLAATLDWINLMSYDFNGSWDKATGHNAPLYRSASDKGPASFDVDASVRAYLSAGVPASKLVLGVPFYGRGWSGVTPGTSGTGLYSSGTGPSTGTWEPGMLDYDDIVANYLPKMTRYWDTTSKVPYLWDATKRVFISYDDPQSMRAKARYVNTKGLGGVMFWELSGDDNSSLLTALNGELT